MARVTIPHTDNPKDAASAGSPRRGQAFLFQVTAPQGTEPLFPVFLALHANPTQVEERMQKSKTVAMTYGGWVEWVWPDELGTVSCESSTGAFLHPYNGLVYGGNEMDGVVASGRKGTIAWERQQDLLELFHNNGMVYNSIGQPVVRGRVMMIYDRGVFVGHFTSFQPTEDDQHPHSFQLSWEFKVEQTLYTMPGGGVSDSSSDFDQSPSDYNPSAAPAPASAADAAPPGPIVSSPAAPSPSGSPSPSWQSPDFTAPTPDFTAPPPVFKK